jgi:hypothetical protein
MKRTLYAALALALSGALLAGCDRGGSSSGGSSGSSGGSTGSSAGSSGSGSGSTDSGAAKRPGTKP